MRKESAGGLLTLSQVCETWAQKESCSGAGNNQSRLLLTLTSSCPAATQTSWCGTKAQWSTIWRQCWVPGGRRWSLVLCCQPLLGSPPELCLPCGTNMALGTPHNSLSVLEWNSLGEHTPANTLLQVEYRTGKWISTRKQKNLLIVSCDWREILLMQSHVISKTNPTVLHFDLYQELLTPLQEKIHLLYFISSWLQFTHVLNVPLDSSNIL